MTFKLFGEVTFSAIGAYCEEMVSELMKNGTVLKNVRTLDNVLYSSVPARKYLETARIARKYGVRTRVTEKKGLYFRLYGFRKRFGLLAGAIISVFLLLILQRFVWKIEVHGNNEISANQVLEILADEGICPGTPVSSFDVNDAEIIIKRRLPGVSWVSVELNGSAVNVYVNESDEIEKSGIPLKTPCNVVAGKTGTILETQVYSGTLMYPVGSGVSEGSVVVSGVVNDGAEHLFLLHANAKIIAEFTETASFSMPYTSNERQATGKVETERELMLFGFVFPISGKIPSHENRICDEYTSVYDFFGIKLPWKIKTYTYTEYEDVSVTRTAADIMKTLERRLDEYCRNFYSEYEILEIEKEVVQNKTDVTLNAKIILKGDIAVQREIWSDPTEAAPPAAEE